MTSKEIYDSATEGRSQYIDRAEEIASMTIPYLMPPKGYSGSTAQEDSIKQSDMASNINSLTSKITMALFPTAASSFRLTPDSSAMEQLTAEGGEAVKAEVMIQLSNETAKINKEVERQDIRPQVFGFVRDVMTTGPVIIEKVEDGIKYHGLGTIAVKLDDKFEPYELAFLEELSRLPEGITVQDEAEKYDLYTSAVRDVEDVNKWIVTQSIGDEVVGDEQTYTDETLPFQYLGWSIAKGDKYHRPYCEQMIGDIRSLNALAQVLTDGAVIASKSLILVDPRGGRTRMRDVAESSNGAVLEGRADDITSFQLNKNYDFQAPMQRLAELKASLERAFLVNQSASRQAERVTATEVSFMAQELETQLAGIYSIMANKVSKRIITWIMQDLKIKFQAIEVNIITGLDSLSRTSEAQKMDAFMQTIAAFGYNNSVKEAEVVQRYADFYGINPVGLFKSQQELQQEQQAASEAAMMQQGGEALAQSAGQGLGQGMTETQQPQEGQVNG